MYNIPRKLPLYCGEHENSRLVQGRCPRCGKDSREFTEPSHLVPVRLAVLSGTTFSLAIILIILFPFVFFGIRALFGRVAYIVLMLGGFFGGIYSLLNLRTIKNTGLVVCSNCGGNQSPWSVWCIYCGSYIKWWVFQRPQASGNISQRSMGGAMPAQDGYLDEHSRNRPPDHFCRTCGQSMKFIQDGNKYYCAYCQSYE